MKIELAGGYLSSMKAGSRGKIKQLAGLSPQFKNMPTSTSEAHETNTLYLVCLIHWPSAGVFLESC